MSQKIDSIAFKGINIQTSQTCLFITKLDTLKNFNLKVVEHAAQTLLNTRIFSKVTWELDTLTTQTILIFNCTKVATFIPIVNMGNVKGNPFLQLGVRDLNFLGRLGVFKLYTIAMNKQLSFYSYTEIPFIGKSKWSLLWDLNFARTQEAVFVKNTELAYHLKSNNFLLGTLYQFNATHKLGISGGYLKQEYSSLTNQYMNRNEKGIQIKLFHSIQKINYNSLRLEGWSIQSELKNTFGNTIAFFQQGIVSSTYYKKISVNGDLALRAKIGFTSNKLGPFGPFTLDSYLNLRGAGTQIDRGTGQLVFNIEYRHAIFETPKVCFQVVVFNDVGTWRKPSQNISQMFEKDSMMAYSGLGTRIFFTKVYDLILRLDYGISITNSLQSGFVFGIGQYF